MAARPIALHAKVSLSGPGGGVTLVDRHMRPVKDRPDWVSVDVFVDVELDDGRLVSRSTPNYIRGGPLDCTRRELEEIIRNSIFSEPRHHPADPPTEPPTLVGQLQPVGVDVTLETLAALPLTITLSDEVEARL